MTSPTQAPLVLSDKQGGTESKEGAAVIIVYSTMCHLNLNVEST
jgi:hypothetical protein